MKQEVIKQKFASVFNSPDGQIVLAEIASHCGEGETLFAVDQLVQNSNVARHDVLVWIKQMMEEV